MLEIELKKAGKIKRLTNITFNFDPRLKEGFYSANYFLKSRKIVKENEPNHLVTMQWFQRKDTAMLCGIDEAIAILHTFVGVKYSKFICNELWRCDNFTDNIIAFIDVATYA